MSDGIGSLREVLPSREARLLKVMEKIETAKVDIRAKNYTREKLIELTAVGMVAGEELVADLEELRKAVGRAPATVAIIDAMSNSVADGYNMRDVVNLALKTLDPEHETLLALKRVLGSVDQASRIGTARKAAKTRHGSGPVAEAREFAQQCWRDWRAKPSQYKSKASFARAMQDKLPDDQSIQQVTIERWVRAWDKAKK